MLKYAVNLCLISFFVIHLASAGDAINKNRRVKRLGVGGRNATQKFKKEVWKQDVGDLFQLEPSTQGIQNVHLKCGSNSMLVKLETDQEFTGVMYTKGNFYDQNEPCFISSKRNRGSRNLSMRFTFDQCNTKYDGSVFSNTIVIQNDPELVTPGDSAFALTCDFRKPRNLNVESTYETESFRKLSFIWNRMASGARIALTSPDPSSNNAPQHTEHMIFSESDSNTVTFNAHKHNNEMASSHDAPPLSISFNTREIDESTTTTTTSSSSSEHSYPQKVKITIDSVAPYESKSIDNTDVEEEIQSSNRVDNIEKSEMSMNEHTKDSNDEKRTKNDEL